jgi:phosphoenolpyruvate carboxykinase (ATP)
LKKLRITNPNVVQNPTVSELYEYALQPEHRQSRGDNSVGPTTITSTGALAVDSGAKTGRVPKAKRIVYDSKTRDTIWWGEVNIPIDQRGYQRNKRRAVDFFNIAPRVFVIDGYAGYDPEYRKLCRIFATRPYHALFIKQMLLRDDEEQLARNFSAGPDFSILNAGEFLADPNTEDVNTETSVNVNFTDNEMVILGTQYAGEMKKGIFGVMHYYMPN